MARVQGQHQRSRPKLTAAQKQERCRWQETLTDAIDTVKLAYAQEAAHIVETHGRCIFSLFLCLFTLTVFFRSLKWTHNQLFLRSCLLRQQCGVNSWNTFVRAKHKEANKGMSLFIFHRAITD